MGKMQAHVMMPFNQYYSDNLSDEVKKGLYERREQGLPLGHIPFGAMARTTDGDGKLPPVPDREPILMDRNGRQWSRYDALPSHAQCCSCSLRPSVDHNRGRSRFHL
jgi:hypothetical protein